MADLTGFTRIYRDLTMRLYALREDDKVIRMVKEFKNDVNDDDSPFLYEEVQGWCENWDEHLDGDDAVLWMANRYSHRKGMEEFIDFCVNHNDTATGHIKYFKED